MDYETDQQQDGRLRLRRRLIWLPPDNDSPEMIRYAMGLHAVVDGMAGAVSLRFRGAYSGADEGSPNAGNAGIGHELMAEAWVECGIAVNGVYVHAYRPWPVSEDAQEHRQACEFLGGRECWAQCVRWPHEARTHGLLTRLVQPGGPPSVLEELEAIYREEFAPALSAGTLMRERQERAVELARARAEGAEMAAAQPVSGTEAVAAVLHSIIGDGSLAVVREGMAENGDVVRIRPPFEAFVMDGWQRIIDARDDDQCGLVLFMPGLVPGDEPRAWELRIGGRTRVRPVRP